MEPFHLNPRAMALLERAITIYTKHKAISRFGGEICERETCRSLISDADRLLKNALFLLSQTLPRPKGSFDDAAADLRSEIGRLDPELSAVCKEAANWVASWDYNDPIDEALDRAFDYEPEDG